MKQIIHIVFLLLFAGSSYAQDLKITEIMYNPAGGDNPWEWIEVFNSGTKIIELAGYVLDDASGAVLKEANISKGSIGPKKSVILFDADDISRQDFSDVWGEVDLIAVTNWSTLGNTGDTIGLWSSLSNYEGDQKKQENVVLQVIYENGTNGWPKVNGQSSIFLNSIDGDTALGSNWSQSKSGTATPIYSAYLTDRPTTTLTGDVGSPGLPKSDEDTEKPVLVCTDALNIILEEEVCAAPIVLVEPKATDNSDGEISVEGIRSDGLALSADFSIGETSVTWTAIDASGNVSEPCVQKITVKDVGLPEIECPTNREVLSADGDPVLLEITYASASDFCDGQISVTGIRSDSAPLDAKYPVGETSIVWKAVDASGNVAECSQFIKVELTESSKNEIVSFTIDNQIEDTEIVIKGKSIKVRMPFGTNVADLMPIVQVSEFATVLPESGSSLDFTEPVIYTVTAQDGTKQDWTVTVETEGDLIAPVFEVNGNKSDFETVLTVGETYIVGAIENIIDKNPTTQKITGADLVATNVVGGSYQVAYLVSDGVNTTTITETVTITAAEFEELAVTSFTLVNADTNEDLFTIIEGMQIAINSLPTTHLDIRANTTTNVGSVRLSLEGALTTARTESLMPYALFQDLPLGDYKGNDFIVGTYTLAATPYAMNSLRGEMGNPFEINFELTDSCGDFEVVLEVVSDLLTCNSSEGAIAVEVRGGVAPYAYSWSHDSLLNTAMATDLVAGEYIVTATDANGCVSSLTTLLKEPELPEVSIFPFESVLDTDEPILLFEGEPYGGEYSGEGVSDGEFDPSIGKGIYEITYTYEDPTTGCTNSATGEIEVLSTEILAVESFTLVNADTNEDLFELSEGMVIDINTLPTLHLDIRANTSETVESVGLSLSGTINSGRTESLVPYALFQDLPIGDYKGNNFVVGNYAVIGVPFSKDSGMGSIGSSFKVNFELVNPNLVVREFMLVNAETNEDLFVIEKGMQININDLPTLHLDIRAITTDDVESVRISLSGALEQERTETLVPYALFQDLPIGDYKGANFEMGSYTVSAVPYDQDFLRGEKGTALAVNFELIEDELSIQTNQLILSPNPASIETSLRFTQPVEVAAIQIYDMLGRVVASFSGEETISGGAYILQLSELESGIYFVNAIDEQGNKHQNQLVIKK